MTDFQDQLSEIPPTTSADAKSQRPNENLLVLGRLRGSNQSTQSSQGVQLEIEEEENLPPPPAYDVVVKFDRTCETVSLPSTSQLPQYQDVAGLQDAPPTYHSLFADKVLRVIYPFSDDNDTAVDATHIVVNSNKFMKLLINFILFIVLVSFVLLLPIAMVVLGIIFIHDCPVQPRIPIYLIVLGFFQMLECCGRLGYKFFQGNQQRNTWRDRYRRKDPLVYFVIVWFVIGSMWVYQTNPDCSQCPDTLTSVNNATVPSTVNMTLTSNFPLTTMERSVQAPTRELYCGKIIYNFAFWIITTYYSIIGFFCLIVLVDVTLRAMNRCCCPRR